MPSSKRYLRLTASAGRDLQTIADYTNRTWGAAQKSKYLSELKATLTDLTTTPEIGTPRDDLQMGLRTHPAGRHIIFYRLSPTHITILRILHKSMEPERHV